MRVAFFCSGYRPVSTFAKLNACSNLSYGSDFQKSAFFSLFDSFLKNIAT